EAFDLSGLQQCRLFGGDGEGRACHRRGTRLRGCLETHSGGPRRSTLRNSLQETQRNPEGYAMTGKTAFETRYGFRRNEVLLANWRENPFNRWSFQNLGELVPTAPVTAAPGGVEAPVRDISGLLGNKVTI